MNKNNPAGSKKIKGTPVRPGNAEVIRIGLKKWHWSDAYHWVLTLSWPRFFVLLGSLYLLVNLVFAAAFHAVPGSVANARAGSFADVFFFSIETLATVGYGYMNPGSIYGHIVASTEIMVGMLCIAVMTGLVFARFSRPTARVMFSNIVVVTPFNGVQTLMLRAGNERNNLILEASVHASLVRREKTQEGQMFLRVYDLKLDRERTSVFALTWTIMHKIDAASPLHGVTAEALIAAEARIVVAMSGLDDTLNDIVHARHSYAAEQVVFSHRFADILVEQGGSVRAVDFTRFHDAVPDGTAS